MKILMAASESYPFAKTGGLGDVLGNLATCQVPPPVHSIGIKSPRSTICIMFS